LFFKKIKATLIKDMTLALGSYLIWVESWRTLEPGLSDGEGICMCQVYPNEGYQSLLDEMAQWSVAFYDEDA
jgi:hypothetical protein